MTAFTTRPELTGTFGMVASTHWIASAVGMRILEQGGNAFDAAVATGLVLQVVEPHLNGPGGDLPALLYRADADRTEVICAQGPAPSGATIAHYRAEGLDLIPGDGLLATVIPGAFDGWMLMLHDWGTLPLRAVLEPAIAYARDGHPLLEAVAAAIAGRAGFFAREWPTSHALWLPGGAVPEPGALFRNPALADCWTRLLTEAEAARGREAQIDAARDAFYRGFVAEAIGRFLADAEVADESGGQHRAVLTADDLAGWRATVEPPATGRYRGWTLAKTGAWGQGPTLLNALGILEGLPLDEAGPGSAELIHLAAEAMKLALADREVYLGDPLQSPVPLGHLLSPEYAAARRAEIGATASPDLRPGRIPGFEDQRETAMRLFARLGLSLIHI